MSACPQCREYQAALAEKDKRIEALEGRLGSDRLELFETQERNENTIEELERTLDAWMQKERGRSVDNGKLKAKLKTAEAKLKDDNEVIQRLINEKCVLQAKLRDRSTPGEKHYIEE